MKKLKRYEKDFFVRRAEEEQGEMPLQRLENENKRLREVCMRSELENEMLALELVNDRVRLKESLDKVRWKRKTKQISRSKRISSFFESLKTESKV